MLFFVAVFPYYKRLIATESRAWIFNYKILYIAFNVSHVLNAIPEGARDIALRERVQYSLYMLHQYAQALAPIRQQHAGQAYPKQQEYCYGM